MEIVVIGDQRFDRPPILGDVGLIAGARAGNVITSRGASSRSTSERLLQSPVVRAIVTVRELILIRWLPPGPLKADAERRARSRAERPPTRSMERA
jgi:hypothetical protein